MSEMSEGFEDIVKQQGELVLINTEDCVTWKLEHKNCVGCKSELGCSKAVSMMGVSLEPILYEPKSYEDFERMNRAIQNKLDRILKARTVEEVRGVVV